MAQQEAAQGAVGRHVPRAKGLETPREQMIGVLWWISHAEIYNGPDEVDGASLSLQLSTFGAAGSMAIYNALLTGQRLLFIGQKDNPAAQVCDMVLSAAAMLCPFRCTMRRAFPYANLNDLGFLGVPGYIAGVTNPMFRGKSGWWDVAAILGDGGAAVVVSAEAEKAKAARLHAPPPPPYAAQDAQFFERRLLEMAQGVAEFADAKKKQRTTTSNAPRLQLLIATPAFRRYVRRQRRYQQQPNCLFSPGGGGRGMDIHALIRRIKHGRPLGRGDACAMFSALHSQLRRPIDLMEFAAQFPECDGGITPFAQGLLHPSQSVRNQCALLLQRLQDCAATRGCVASLNLFLVLAHHSVLSAIAAADDDDHAQRSSSSSDEQ